MIEKNLLGKTAVVTGATSGIGRAIAVRLAELRATVFALGRQADALAALERQSRASRLDMHTQEIELASDEELQKFVSEMRKVNILVHGAGHIKHGAFKDAPVSDLDWHYQVNLRAPYLLTQLLLPNLIETEGQIVFINSSADRPSGVNKSQYAATKYGLLAMSECLRDEVKVHGIRVMNMFLGRVATPMQEAVHKMEKRLYEPDKLIQPEDVADAVAYALMTPRTAEVANINIRATI